MKKIKSIFFIFILFLISVFLGTAITQEISLEKLAKEADLIVIGEVKEKTYVLEKMVTHVGQKKEEWFPSAMCILLESQKYIKPREFKELEIYICPARPPIILYGHTKELDLPKFKKGETCLVFLKKKDYAEDINLKVKDAYSILADARGKFSLENGMIIDRFGIFKGGEQISLEEGIVQIEQALKRDKDSGDIQ